MNAISEPAVESAPDDAPEVVDDVQAAKPKGRVQMDLLPLEPELPTTELPEPDSALRRVQRTYRGAVWAPRDWERFRKERQLPPWSFLELPQFDANPCAVAVREARQKVEKAEQAIKNWHEKLGELQANLKNAIEHHAQVVEAYARLRETGELDRELLTPQCEHDKSVLLSNDQAKAHNELCANGRKIEDIIFDKGKWTIKALRADERYEYIKLRKPIEISDVVSAVVDDTWTISSVDASGPFIYVTIRRERKDPLTNEAADRRITEGAEFVFKRWQETPGWRKYAIIDARLDRAFAASVSSASQVEFAKPAEGAVRPGEEPATGPPN